ncbi:4-hydroxy-tetrahydrodipicolinate synthase [Ferrovibrio xuzhouensis]|uniref:4-hydroxy-tetrahydrodipicolinate synthase n=1 Tax=Ferrovibrio xuzhouensis TaxID=1576914 RepID=A0ABV7VCS5_9PROT
MADAVSSRWKKLRGSIPALITPFRDGMVDHEALVTLADRQIRRGSAGLVAAGSTGEALSLTETEYRAVLTTVVTAARRRVPVIAGVSAASTELAIATARAAERADVDLLLCSMPYYLRPTQEGLFRHVRAVHDAVGIPLVLYDVPARTGCALSDETVARLYELPRVIGLKDATGDLARPHRLRRLAGDGLLQFSGDDATAVEHRIAGGQGCISVTANVVPGLCAALQAQFDAGNLDALRLLQRRLRPLTEALFLESNPIPVKRALHRLGFCADELRLPLMPLSTAADAVLAAELEVVWAAEECLARGAARVAGTQRR